MELWQRIKLQENLYEEESICGRKRKKVEGGEWVKREKNCSFEERKKNMCIFWLKNGTIINVSEKILGRLFKILASVQFFELKYNNG